jgi:hypothetical protein
MKPQEEILLIIGLAILWFGAALFAVAALIPSWAFPASLLAVAIVTLTYKILDATDNLTVGLVVTLFFIPLICIAAGIIWWVMRLLGVLEIR